MNKARHKLPKPINQRIERATTAATMSRRMLPGPQPLIDALEDATADFAGRQEAALAIRKSALQATSELRRSGKRLASAYANLASGVQMAAAGNAAFIVGAGFKRWAPRTPLPPPEAPTRLLASAGSVPGTVSLRWSRTRGTKLHKVEYSSDLTGETGWVAATEMAGPARLSVPRLVSGTRYVFRVRALGTGVPSPWSATIEQMAP